ncbi:hypothetical protein ACFL1R_06640 [Candidatus Latescibacterota bacterium]
MNKNAFLVSLILTVSFIMTSVTIEGRELTIVYTANSNGKLTDCKCSHDPYGGLAERVTLIRKLREREEPFLLVDSGNMVSLFGDYDFKAESVMRIMNLMNYDAAAAGRNELYMGIEKARVMSHAAQFPLISATIADNKKHKRVFSQSVIKKTGNTTVGVIAVCDSSCYILTDLREHDYMILEPYHALRSVVVELAPECDFIVVLSQMAHEKNKLALQKIPEIDLIVEGYGNKMYDSPVVSGKGLIVSPGGSGKHVGLITIEKSQDKLGVIRSELIPVLDTPIDTKAGKIVQEYQKGK